MFKTIVFASASIVAFSGAAHASDKEEAIDKKAEIVVTGQRDQLKLGRLAGSSGTSRASTPTPPTAISSAGIRPSMRRSAIKSHRKPRCRSAVAT